MQNGQFVGARENAQADVDAERRIWIAQVHVDAGGIVIGVITNKGMINVWKYNSLVPKSKLLLLRLHGYCRCYVPFGHPPHFAKRFARFAKWI